MPTRAPRPCLDCGHLTRGTRCPVCSSAHERQRDSQRGNSAARDYGHAHRAERDRLLPYALGTPCPRCGWIMLTGQALDLGHAVSVAHGGRRGPKRIEHAACNRAAGATTRRR